ncbi:RICIN domain-containing protein [Streptomyces sp. NPDC012438]|uniref:RICIN domain-containing protein n=1 Tax=Streptomyces sp. NPDC012438 TaxID=3364833 RepID=UPI0036E97647
MCKRCGGKFTDERWEEIAAHRTAVRAGDKSVCGPCRADDVACEEAARLRAAAAPEPQDGPEPERGRGWFRRRTRPHGPIQRRRPTAGPAQHHMKWTATPPTAYEGKGFYWIKAGNGSCLTVPYNNGTPPGNGTQLFWWQCETRWSSGSQLWNVIPVDQYGRTRAYHLINQRTGKCLTPGPATTGGKVGKVTQATCPA